MRKLLILYISVALLAMACKKEAVTRPNSGIYRGLFTKTYNNGDTVASGVSYLSISTSSYTFSLSGDTVTQAPYSCGGYFSVSDDDLISFDNTANVNTGINAYFILDTVWNYYFNDHKFNLWLRKDTVLYQYRLVRI